MNYPDYPHPQYSSPALGQYTGHGYRFPSRYPGTPPRYPSISSVEDELSPEYTIAMQQNSVLHPDEERDVQRALQVQARARERVKSSTSQYPAYNGRSHSMHPRSRAVSSTHPIHSPSHGREHSYEMHQEIAPQSAARLRKFRFPRIKDSLSLSYTQTLTRSPSAKKDPPPPLQLAPTRPHGHKAKVIPVNTSVSAASTSPERYTSTRSSNSSSSHRMKRAPLSRHRVQSLPSVVENTGEDFDYDSEDDFTPTTPNTRMRRQRTVDDLFAQINYKARALGLGTQL